MNQLFTFRSLRRGMASRTSLVLALMLAGISSLRAQYSGPVPAPTDAFGGPGPYQVLTETFPSPGWANQVVTVLRPAGVTGPRPTWLFAHGFAGSRPEYYIEMLNHLASHGSVVVFSPYPANLLRVEENYRILFDGFIDAAQRFPDQIDTSRVGFAGHSYGGGAVPALALRAVRERNWGANGLALLLLAPWYSYFVSDADLASFPARTQVVVQIYEDDTVNDHRMAIDIFRHLTISPANKDYLMIRSDQVEGYEFKSNHLVPTGVANPRPDVAFDALDAWGVLRIAQALTASALENDFAARDVALGNGSPLQTQMGATSEGQALLPMVESEEPVPLFPSSQYVQSFDSRLNPRRGGSIRARSERGPVNILPANAHVGEGANRR